MRIHEIQKYTSDEGNDEEDVREDEVGNLAALCVFTTLGIVHFTLD